MYVVVTYVLCSFFQGKISFYCMDEMKSFICAFISGIIHVVVGHPFDTIKTLQQSRTSVLQLTNLYRGLSFPLIQYAIVNSATFGTKHTLTQKYNKYISYTYCGVISTIICAPLDKYKIMRQYKNHYDLSLKNIVYSYKDLPIVALRKVPFTFVYFATYDRGRYNSLPSYMSGGLAGALATMTIYPIDTVKTRIQGGECSTIKQSLLKGGLFRGLPISLARTVLVNAVNFSSYEFLMNNLKISTPFSKQQL